MLLSMVLMLISCTTTGISGPDPNAVACRLFHSITWSEDDTRETIRQIKAHNAAWKAVCN